MIGMAEDPETESMEEMRKAYQKLEVRSPDSPLLKLIHIGSNGLTFTNEFSARYPADVYTTPKSAQSAYAEDLEEAYWKATHPYD